MVRISELEQTLAMQNQHIFSTNLPYIHYSGIPQPLTEADNKEAYYVENCPLRELPLYINTIFAPIAKRRLKNAKS